MQPFITKYAKLQTKKEVDKKSISFEYCTENESNIIVGSADLVMNVQDVSVEFTGTLVTKADTDTTRDESTDR
jgi:hypothetical protein